MPLCKILSFKSRDMLWRKESGAEHVYELGNTNIKDGIRKVRELSKDSNLLTTLFINGECVYAIDASLNGVSEYYRPFTINDKVIKLAQEVCFAAESCFYFAFNRPKWLESLKVVDGKPPVVICCGNLGETHKVSLKDIMKSHKYENLSKPLDCLIELLGSEVQSVGSISIIDWTGINSPYIDMKHMWCSRRYGDSDWDCVLHKRLF